MVRLASQADLCYNQDIKLLWLNGASNTVKPLCNSPELETEASYDGYSTLFLSLLQISSCFPLDIWRKVIVPAPKDPEKYAQWISNLSKSRKGGIPHNKGKRLSPIVHTEKECIACHKVRPIEVFGLNWRMRDGHVSECNSCVAAKRRSERVNKPKKRVQYEPRHIMDDKELARFLESFTLTDCGYSSQCWHRDGHAIRKGYTLMRVGDGRKMLGHRLAYEHFIGPISEGDEIDHLCKNRVCANPDHLEAVAHAENIRRSAGTKGTSFQHKISRKQFQWRLKRQGFCCYYCKIKLGEDRKAYHLDHVIPLARGGTHDLKNIVFACPPCNMRKNNKTLEEWAETEKWLLKSSTIRERIRRDRASILAGRADAVCVIEEPAQ